MAYVRAGAEWLATFLPFPVALSIDSTPGGPLHPIIADTLNFRRKWKPAREKREPFTMEMFEWMDAHIREKAALDRNFLLGMEASIFDWIRLGVFTGSRVGEYAQTNARVGEFSRVPDAEDAGEWAGSPLAFVADDFTLFDAKGCIIKGGDLINRHMDVEQQNTRFRFDKSKENFSIRKFRRTKHKFLCPAKATTSILVRARKLGIPKDCPIGAYRHPQSPGGYRYLRAVEIIKFLRFVCLQAHPDPNHFMHKNVKRVVAHSNRVTAAVALANAGHTIEAIAYRLRWTPDSVKHYLRECAKNVGKLSSDVIAGACLI